MIKKILHILPLAVLFYSCEKDAKLDQAAEPASIYDEIGTERDGKVTLGFNVEILDGTTAGTRSLAEKPDIKNIYVAVFDSIGYKLSEYVKANPITAATENDKKYQFTIQLKVSDQPRVLHFIANGPEELRFGTEQEVIGELYTRYDADESDEFSRKDAYWQRLVFDKIHPRPEGIDDGSEAWQNYNSMVETLSNLKLIRNFSKITLSKREPGTSDSQTFRDFEIKGMWFVNYPDRGSIAPYNRNTGLFGTDTENGDSTYLDYTDMTGVEDPDRGNYQGFTLASTSFITPASFIETGDDKNMIDAASNTAYGYVYEREKALTSPMYLIAKCIYNGNPTYYKIAMQDDDGNFYAMLRNFNYTVQIQSVIAAGYSSAQAALEGAPTGDVSVNIDYQDLPNISDGNARITVSATKLLIVGEVGQPTTASFWYKYEPDIRDHEETGIHNDLATGDDATDQANPHVVITYAGSEGSSGAVVNTLDVNTSNKGGNRYVTISTTNVSATPKTQTITIEGRNWNGERYLTITRTVQLVLRGALDMNLSASPNTDSDGNAYVTQQKDQPFVLNLGIESGLPSSMFPLSLKIEPSAKTITPDNAYSSVQELPVRYGTDAAGHPTYWFEKSISWAEYKSAPEVDGIKTLPAYFKTLVAASATTLTVSNENFISKSVDVRNYTPAHFATASLSGTTHTVGTEETFSFTIDKNYTGDILLTMKGFEPSADEAERVIYQSTDSEGNRIYKMSLSSYTTGSTVSFDVIPYRSGVAYITLSGHLFEDKKVEANNIDGSVIGIDVTDLVSGNVKSNVIIKSYGSAASYIRAAVVANWYDDEGNIVAPLSDAPGIYAGLPGSGWTLSNGIYYYGSSVGQGGSPNPLFTSYTRPSTPPVPGAHLEMTIMVQAIPYVSGKTCQQAFAE